ncbi:glycyl-radical enzyme activating protein [Chloroflexota bacterium]
MRSSKLLNESKTAVNKRMIIDITRMTVHNGPGIRTLILFKGCPLRCAWCSTPESQRESPEIAFYPDRCIRCDECLAVCPRNAITVREATVAVDRELCDNCGRCTFVCYAEALKLLGREYTVEELVSEVIKDDVVYRNSGGGVTVSGGEPFQKPDFLLELLQELKTNKISAGVDTCGFTSRKNIEAVLPYVDFFLWDIKHMNREKHIEYTGVSNELILDNARFVAGENIPLFLRLPVIPGYNDSEDNLLDLCDFAKTLTSLEEIDLLPLHHLGKARYAALDREYPIDGIPLIEEEILDEMKRLVESTGLKCNIIG